jgi:ADP-ribose pyrophosphatase
MRFFFMILFTLPLFATSLEDYLSLMKQHPKTLGPLGNHKNGEIEIVISPETLLEIQELAEKRLIDKGVAPLLAYSWSRIGIVAEDQYLYWLRDGVLFPSGIYGTYDRIIWKSGFDGPPGVAIVPLLEKKIIVNLNYRHATRSWEIELPRGLRKKEESLREVAARELKEEAGYILDDVLLLGTMAIDSGILSSQIPVILCKAGELAEPSHDYSEAIISNITLTVDQLETALLQGFWNVYLPDQTIRAAVRDPFLAYALLHIKLHHW